MSQSETRLRGESIPKVAKVPGTQYPMGFEQITSLSSATALTIPDGARIALVHATGQDVQWRDDGIDPTATIGMLLPVNGELNYDGDLTAIRFIEATSGATLNISYYA